MRGQFAPDPGQGDIDDGGVEKDDAGAEYGGGQGPALGAAQIVAIVWAMERSTAIAEYDSARDEFLAAMAAAPDAALPFLRDGDEYALGGLYEHCNWVLDHYRRVLGAIVDGGSAPFTTEVRTAEEAASDRLAKNFPEGGRPAQLRALTDHHERVRALAMGLTEADFERKTAVRFGAAPEPYPTSPDDILGWLRDHYREHVPQAADLIADWRRSSG
ncbi:MAG: hypothetical protein NVS9B1_11030 [Candidatus Dormibacteraceae bacterium]